MIVEQRVKEAEITEHDSLLVTMNLLRIAIFNISYMRGLFPEKYFRDKVVPNLDIKMKELMPMDPVSKRLIDCMEKDVYDALQTKCLGKLMFCVCQTGQGPMIEEYSFSFSYPNVNSQEVYMNVNQIGNKKQVETFKWNNSTTNQMKSYACKMVRILKQLMTTLDTIPLPEKRTILVKLLAPADYVPPISRGCIIEEEARNPWKKMEVSLDDDDEYYICASCEGKMNRVKDWISTYQQDNLDVTDVLSNFPGISLASIEVFMNKLVNEGFLSKSGNDSFNMKRPEKTKYEFDDVREQTDGKKSQPTMLEGQMNIKALFDAISKDYITIRNPQSKLGGEVNQTPFLKLKDKMTKECRIGKQVIDSEITNKKLPDQVRKALDFNAVVDHKKTSHSENQAGPSKSTLNGSDLSGKPELQQRQNDNQVLQPIENNAGMKKGRRKWEDSIRFNMKGE